MNNFFATDSPQSTAQTSHQTVAHKKNNLQFFTRTSAIDLPLKTKTQILDLSKLDYSAIDGSTDKPERTEKH